MRLGDENVAKAIKALCDAIRDSHEIKAAGFSIPPIARYDFYVENNYFELGWKFILRVDANYSKNNPQPTPKGDLTHGQDNES